MSSMVLLYGENDGDNQLQQCSVRNYSSDIKQT